MILLLYIFVFNTKRNIIYVPLLLHKVFTINQNFKYIFCLQTNIDIYTTKPNLFFTKIFFLLILRLCKNTKHSKISHNRVRFFHKCMHFIYSNPKYYCSSFVFIARSLYKSICARIMSSWFE